jgi:2-polyprenyl-6-hydroxyphenyl methylase/3-demethylubiquinone-9 3-methyltransferase
MTSGTGVPETVQKIKVGGYLEFGFQESEEIESHSYLLPAVRNAIGTVGDRCRVVDLGCGNGDLLAALKQPGWQAHGVDLSGSGIAEGKRRHAEIEFHLRGFDDSLVADLGAGRFDVIISTEVIEHLYAPREICRVAFELLKPGGLFVVSTPYHGYLKNCALALTGKFDKHFTALRDCGHIKFWSFRTLSVLLTEAGFDRMAFRGAGRVPWLWKSMVVSTVKPATRQQD